MNRIFLSCFCAIIFLPIIVNGLQCYYCAVCNDPFDKNSATIATTNSTSQSCFKMGAAGVASRGAMDSCVEINSGNTGSWCCKTDLCNAAQATYPMNLKIFISALLLIIAMRKTIF